VEAHGASGLNVWIPLPEESTAVQGLMRKGWAVQAGERYRIRAEPAIRVTVSALEPRDAERFADDLASLFAAKRRTSAA
jgi:DNA-binding transcriptional MocR family regulator